MKKICYLLVCAGYFSTSLSSHAVFQLTNNSKALEEFDVSIYTKMKKSDIGSLTSETLKPTTVIYPEKGDPQVNVPIRSLKVIEKRLLNGMEVNKLKFNPENEEIIFNTTLNLTVKPYSTFALDTKKYVAMGEPLFFLLQHRDSMHAILFQPEATAAIIDNKIKYMTRDNEKLYMISIDYL